MVGAAGPLRNGDDVEFLLPPLPPAVTAQKTSGGTPPGSVHAVGAVRVQVREPVEVLYVMVMVPCKAVIELVGSKMHTINTGRAATAEEASAVFDTAVT